MASRTSGRFVLALVFWLSNARAFICFPSTWRSLPFASDAAPIHSIATTPFSSATRCVKLNIQPNSDDSGFNAKYPTPPHMTVLLPAYNEVQRIGDTIEAYQSYLSESKEWKGKSRILVVDDGSVDGTADLVTNWKSHDYVGLDCVSLTQNEGKGAAVSFGIQHMSVQATNHACLILIADADGSGDISGLDKMVISLGHLIDSQPQCLSQESSFWKTPALVVGNRGYEGSSLARSILRWGFRTTVRILCGDLRVSDSQCGFKLLTLEAAQRLYADLHLKRWSHDVEVLFRAREWNMPITEETVPWQDKEGSKLVTSIFGAVQASIVMLLEVLRMRLEYATGRWELPSEEGN